MIKLNKEQMKKIFSNIDIVINRFKADNYIQTSSFLIGYKGSLEFMESIVRKQNETTLHT